MPDDDSGDDDDATDSRNLRPQMRTTDDISDQSDNDDVEEMSDGGDAEAMFVSSVRCRRGD